MATQADYGPALDVLGFLYEKGKEIERNLTEAKALNVLHRFAIEEDNVEALRILAKVYSEGELVAKDEAKAKSFSRRAERISSSI